ncbi:MAG TPA: hypothetical protein EYP25_01930 [Anaerolineae bacterium]|nr:hypothetical protein [Caldilineae bacterium]HID33329.1 hypothetical protein [Anaerolineae bacterium]
MPTLDQFLTLTQRLNNPALIASSVLLVAAMLVFSDWRWALFAFAGVKVLAGVLFLQLMPPEWALQQWVAGGLVGIMWFLAARRVDVVRRRQLGVPWWKPEWRLNPSSLMRLAFTLLLLVLVYTVRPYIPFPKLPADLARYATFLALAGLVALGLGDRPMRWGFGLSLWLLAASFSIHALQTNVDTVGMMAGVELILGFAISYFIVVDGARFWPRPEDA